VGEVLEDQQALLDDLVALLPLDVRDEADAAGVVLIGRVVEALRTWRGGRAVSNIAHGSHLVARSAGSKTGDISRGTLKYTRDT
jgi:hypothetical protein